MRSSPEPQKGREACLVIGPNARVERYPKDLWFGKRLMRNCLEILETSLNSLSGPLSAQIKANCDEQHLLVGKYKNVALIYTVLVVHTLPALRDRTDRDHNQNILKLMMG